jgi:hypothetical protein
MYVIIGSHFVPLEDKFLLIALVIVMTTLNVIVRQMLLNNGVSIVQKLVKLSNTLTMLFPPVAKTLSKCSRV